MFRKTYDSLSLGVHVELLLDADRICLKSWLQISENGYNDVTKYKETMIAGHKYSSLPSREYAYAEAPPYSMAIDTKHDDPDNPMWNGTVIEKSLRMPNGTPEYMEWPGEVEGVYHKYMPAGRIMGQVIKGEEFIPNIPEHIRDNYIEKLKGKYFQAISYSWIDPSDPSISSGEKSDAGCWVIGIGYDGHASPAYNALATSYNTKAHPLRSVRQSGSPSSLFVYQSFIEDSFNKCSLTLKYNKGYGFSTNIDGWESGTTEQELFAGGSYNYLGQLNEAFPHFDTTNGGGNIEAGGEDTVNITMLDNDDNIISKNCWVYLNNTGGYLPKTRVFLKNGKGSFKVMALGLTTGDTFKVKIGFRNYTGITDVEYTVI